MGSVSQVGEQATNIGAQRVLASKLPDSVTGRDDRPPVRLVAAGDAFRRAGGDVGHSRTW
jgi:hypothetical protein